MTLRLLVADDSVTIQKVIGLAFQDTDTVIESVTNGEKVAEAIRTFCPNVLLADICMPVMNGYEICSLIKNSPDFSHVPVVLLVGTFEKFDEPEALRVHYDARLTKPFDSSELVNVVNKLVGRNDMSQEIESGSDACSNQKETPIKDSTRSSETAKKSIHVSRRALDSFVGEGRVLDLFEAESKKEEDHLFKSETAPSVIEEKTAETERVEFTAEMLSEEVLDTIVERVVKKMSEDIISEIAWEIVPELSEIMIRRSIEENNKIK